MLKSLYEKFEVVIVRILAVLVCLVFWYFAWHFGWYAINQWNETKRIEEELSDVKNRVQYLENLRVEEDGSVIVTWEGEE